MWRTPRSPGSFVEHRIDQAVAEHRLDDLAREPARSGPAPLRRRLDRGNLAAPEREHDLLADAAPMPVEPGHGSVPPPSLVQAVGSEPARYAEVTGDLDRRPAVASQRDDLGVA